MLGKKLKNMKKFYRNFIRVWRTGFTKSLRMMHIFLPLILFFTLVISFSGAFFFAYGLASDLIQNFESKLNVVVYFDRKATQESIDSIVGQIQNRSDVSQVEYISPNQALESFKEKHQNEKTTMEALDETDTNPFGASVVVFAKDPTAYQNISTDLNNLNANFKEEDVAPIEDISYENHKVAIDRFGSMLKKGEIIFSIVLILVSLVLLFIVYLALRFATQGDREEIKVMKLVGAPTMLMVGPTTVMGISSGVLGGILSLFLLYFLAREMTPYTLSFSSFNLYLWYLKHLPYFIGFNLCFGLIIGFCGSLLAIRRHL
jgi:cell division transport system permease protein